MNLYCHSKCLSRILWHLVHNLDFITVHSTKLNTELTSQISTTCHFFFEFPWHCIQLSWSKTFPDTNSLPLIMTVWHIVISIYQEQKFYGLINEVPSFSILRETYPQNFSWVLVNMWVQFMKKNTACYWPFKNGHFVWRKWWTMNIGKATRETQIQTIIRWELGLNTLQINQNNYTLSTFSLSNRWNRRFWKSAGRFCIWMFNCQSIVVQLYQPMLLRLLLFMLSLLCVYK